MREVADRSLTISARIKPMLAGEPPYVQGAVLADLVSIWLAGHHPTLRHGIMSDWVDAVHKLVPASEQEIFPHGRPLGWR